MRRRSNKVRVTRRATNAGEGYGFTFHGAFTEKADAVAKEAKTPGSFIKGMPTKKGYRWVVMKPRTNPSRRKKQITVGDKKFSRFETAHRYALKQAENFQRPIWIIVRESDGTELSHTVNPPARSNPPAEKFNKTANRERRRAVKLYQRMSSLLAAGKFDRSDKLRMQLARLNAKMGWDMAYVASFARAGNPEGDRVPFKIQFRRDGRVHTWERYAVSIGEATKSAREALRSEFPDGLYQLISVKPIAGNPAELLVMGNPAELLVMGNPGDDPWVEKAAAQLYPGKSVSQLSVENDEISRVLQLAAELKREHQRSAPAPGQNGRRSNVEFGEYAGGIFHPWTRRPRTRRKKATRRLSVNPAAADLRAAFTGRPADWVSIAHEPHMPAGDYAQLGELLALYVKPKQGGQVLTINIGEDRPAVVADETGRQIYFVGGDQDVSGALHDFGAVDRGDGIFELGAARRIDYKQRKEHVPEPDVDEWRHEFGEETGVRPTLLFDRNARRLLLEGGAYEIRPEGIVN